MPRSRRSAVVLPVLFAGGAALACGSRMPSVTPNVGAPAPDAGGPAFAVAAATPTTPVPVPASMITHGVRAAELERHPVPPDAPVCAKEERGPLSFEHVPTYTEKIELDGVFTARFFIGNASPCTRTIALPLSFTPPKMTSTRTIDFAAFVPPRGAFVEIALDAAELTESDVVPGRYAITFAVLDEDGHPVGRAHSGNPFRRGRDEVALASAPTLPARIGVSEELVVPFSIHNAGDTANRVTPLVVFTRPGETAGIEHYEPAQLVVPGTSTYTLRLSREAREAEGILPGAWLVTVTMFDAAGDRLNSFAGIPLAIGKIDVRMTRPELPVRVKVSAPLRARFKVDNRGDTPDRITAVLALTKPGTTSSIEFSFTREVASGPLAFDAVVEPARLREKGVDRGVWLVTAAAFQSSGARIKSFTGHYLEIVE